MVSCDARGRSSWRVPLEISGRGPWDVPVGKTRAPRPRPRPRPHPRLRLPSRCPRGAPAFDSFCHLPPARTEARPGMCDVRLQREPSHTAPASR